MLPIINEEIFETVIDEIMSNISGWRKSMIHYVKDENPEINSALVALSQKTDLDPKALATGAYAVYKMLELAQSEQSYITDEDE